jgi:hypothetical protein
MKRAYILRRPVVSSLIVSAVVLGAASLASAQHVHDGASGLPHGIPDFCASPTITSTSSGNWSSASTWSPARVPGANDRVRVASGNVVTYDTVSSSDLNCINVDGQLTFRTDINTRLQVGTLMIKDSGALEVGRVGSPVNANVTAEIVFANVALNTTTDPEQYGTGIIGFGRVYMHGAVLSPTFTRFSSEPKQGDTVVHLSQVPSDWRAGHRIVIPDTRQLRINENSINGGTYVPQWEVGTIASITGSQVTLTAPLQFNHLGARSTLTNSHPRSRALQPARRRGYPLRGVPEHGPHHGAAARQHHVRRQ